MKKNETKKKYLIDYVLGFRSGTRESCWQITQQRLSFDPGKSAQRWENQEIQTLNNKIFGLKEEQESETLKSFIGLKSSQKIVIKYLQASDAFPMLK